MDGRRYLCESSEETAARFIALRHKTKGLVRGLCLKCRRVGHDTELCHAPKPRPPWDKVALSEEAYLISVATGAPFSDIGPQLGLAACTISAYWKRRTGGALAPYKAKVQEPWHVKRWRIGQAVQCAIATGASFYDVAPQFDVCRQDLSVAWQRMHPGMPAPRRAWTRFRAKPPSLGKYPVGQRATWAASAAAASGMPFSDVARQFGVSTRAVCAAWFESNPGCPAPVARTQGRTKRERDQAVRDAVAVAIATGMSFADLAHAADVSTIEIASRWRRLYPGCPEPAEVRLFEPPVAAVPAALRCRSRMRINQTMHECTRRREHAGLHDAGTVQW
jgi:transposase-like protein